MQNEHQENQPTPERTEWSRVSPEHHCYSGETEKTTLEWSENDQWAD